MLIWADRDPVPRRWVLKPTIFVGSCLFIAVAASVAVEAIPLRMVAANPIALPSVVALWTFSYLNARHLDGA